jgi:predicted dehydrogenase
MSKRLVIVGMGSIGLRHARLYSALEEMVVEGCDSRPEGLKELLNQAPNTKCWNDFQEMLRSRPDYLLIATPHHLHAEMACAALEQGIPVLCEKPMSHRLEDAERMARTAEKTGVPLAVGFHLRFHPSVQRLNQMLQSSEIGDLIFTRYCVDSLVTLENSRSRYQEHMSGALIMDYSHGLDLLLHLLHKKPSSIQARGVAGQVQGFHANPLLISGIFGYEGGLQAEVHLSYIGKPEVHTLEIGSSRYRLLVELNSGCFYQTCLEDGTLTDFSAPYNRDALYLEQWRAFQDYCNRRQTSICDFEEALKVNSLMDDFLSKLNTPGKLSL